MPFLILLGALSIWGIASAKNTIDKTTSKSKAFTPEELDRMLGQMIGTSKREARQIVKSYRKR